MQCATLFGKSGEDLWTADSLTSLWSAQDYFTACDKFQLHGGAMRAFKEELFEGN